MATTTAKLIKLSNGNTTYIPITSTVATQHNTGTDYEVLESYLGKISGRITQNATDISKNSTDISTLASALLNTYTKIVDYENSYVKPVSGHENQIMVYLPTTGTNKYNDTITIDNVEHAGEATTLATAPTLNNTTVKLTVGGKDSASLAAGPTTYGFTKVETTPVENSGNAISSGYVKSLANTVDTKADGSHTHTLEIKTKNDYIPADNVNTVSVLTYFDKTSVNLGTTTQAFSYTRVTVPTTHYVDDAIADKFADVASALKYKGTIGTGSVTETHVNTLPLNAETGDVWVVSSEGTYASKACEVGDYIIYNGTSWDVLNGENQVKQETANKTFKVNGGEKTLVNVDGTDIKLSIEQDDDVIYQDDLDSTLSSYVNALNNTVGTGVVTGAKLETNGGAKKLTLSYTDNSSSFTGGSALKTVTAYTQSTSGKITSVTFSDIPTFTGATTSRAGTVGLVPQAPQKAANEVVKVLGDDGQWKTLNATIDNEHNVTTNLKYSVGSDVTLADIFGSFTDGPEIVTIADHTTSISL